MGTINIKNIKLDDCACPKLGEKVTKPNPCITENMGYVAGSQVSDGLVFKVKNLFGELKSDWQKAEARKNLKVPEIVRFTLTKFGEGPGDENIWEMVTSTGNEQKIYRFVVKNGEGAALPQIKIGKVTLSDDEPTVSVSLTDKEIILDFGIPQGPEGSEGAPGTPGTDGASITRVTMYYNLSDSASNAPLSGWKTLFLNPDKDYPYLWAYLAFTTSDNNTLKASPFILRIYLPAVNPGGGTVEVLQTITNSTTLPVASNAIKSALAEKADISKLKTINGQSIYKLGDNDSDNITITGGNGSGLVDDLLDLDSNNAIENSTVTKALLNRALISNFAKINNTPIYDPQNPGKNIEIPINNNEMSVGVYSSEEDANATICFFPDGLLQGVGLYNILLRDGSITGNDGNVYTYHPNKLYHIYNDGSFDELENDETKGLWTTFNDTKNLVYYNYINSTGHHRKLTTLKHYGEIIPSNTVLYAQTSDTAYFNLLVSGPFFGDSNGETKVKIQFDSTKIKIEQVEVTGVTEYKITKNTWPVVAASYPKFRLPTTLKTAILSGSYITFRYNDYNKTRYFIITRKYTKRTSGPIYEALTTPMNTKINFSTPIESVDVVVKYSKAYLLFKSNLDNLTSIIDTYKPETKVSSDNPNYIYRTVMTKVSDNSAIANNLYLLNTSSKDSSLPKFKMDLDKKYYYYAKVRNIPAFDQLCVAVKWDEWAKGVDAQSNNWHRFFDSSRRGHNATFLRYALAKFGEGVVSTALYTCRIEDGDITHYIPNMKTLNGGKAEIELLPEYYMENNGSNAVIEEIGILEYDTKDPVEIGESKLIVKV